LVWSSYSGLTVSPDGLVSEVLDYAPLPAFPEVEDIRRLDDPAPGGDPLVPIVHRSIHLLRAYWHAGWTRAEPVMSLRAQVADRLYKVADGLPEGYGLAIFDAWRPLALQAEIYRAVNSDGKLLPGYFAQPRTDPLNPPPHSTGGAVDLTLTYEGAAFALGSAFDEFSPNSNVHAYEQRPGLVRSLRRMLFWRLHEQGFVGIRTEWWHFEFGTIRWAARTGLNPIYGRVP